MTDGTDTTTWVYLYDAAGQRWARIEVPTAAGSTPQATVYLGDTEITDKNTSTDEAEDVTAVRYFTFGGATVAMVQAVEVEPFEPADEVPFFFLFGDYQGSAQVVMPDVRDATTGDYDLAASADEVLRNAYTPYGATRAVGFGAGAAGDDDAQFERTWLSQVADETTATLGTGLTYLNARYYDPVSSRFLSPDPLLNVMDPKTLDPYRYADNNPIVFTDASGLWSVESVCSRFQNLCASVASNYEQKHGLDSLKGMCYQYSSAAYCDKNFTASTAKAHNGSTRYDRAKDAAGAAATAKKTNDDRGGWQLDGWETAEVIATGLHNFGAGFVDAASGTADLVADSAACGGVLFAMMGCDKVPDIAKVGIIGDPDIYGASYLSGEIGFDLALGAVTGGAGSAAGIGTQSVKAVVSTARASLSRAAFSSNGIGITSRIFGNSAFTANGISGALNQAGRVFKAGWSSHNGNYVFRVGLGRKPGKPNVARFHPVQLFRVPWNIGNALLKGK